MYVESVSYIEYYGSFVELEVEEYCYVLFLCKN